jgi:hypothetical protein
MVQIPPHAISRRHINMKSMDLSRYSRFTSLYPPVNARGTKHTPDRTVRIAAPGSIFVFRTPTSPSVDEAASKFFGVEAVIHSCQTDPENPMDHIISVETSDVVPRGPNNRSRPLSRHSRINSRSNQRMRFRRDCIPTPPSLLQSATPSLLDRSRKHGTHQTQGSVYMGIRLRPASMA